MYRLFSTLFCISVLSTSAFGAEPMDLGGGLSYVRIRNLATEMNAEPPATATVIDLRGTEGGNIQALEHLSAWMAASSKGPLRLVLIDSTTGTEILNILNQRQRFAITVAAASPALSADVSVATTMTADRLAREALDGGTALQDVLAPRVEKRRYDEASMVKDHANGVPLPESPPDLTESPDEIAPASPKTPNTPAEAASVKPGAPAPKAPALFDAVLQRAIHVYQALVALKKA